MVRILKQYFPLRNAIFVFGECLVIFSAIVIADRLISGQFAATAHHVLYLKIFIFTAVLQVCLYYNELYDFNAVTTFSEMVIRMLQSIGAASIILALFYFFFPLLDVTDKVFFLSILFIVMFTLLWRFAYIQVLDRGLFDQKIILLGSGEFAQSILQEISSMRDSGYAVCAVSLESVDDEKAVSELGVDTIFRKNHEGLSEIARDMGVNKIVVALKEQRGAFPKDELLKCRVDGIHVMRGNTFFETLTGRLTVEHINPAWLIYSYGFRKSPPVMFFKRVFDLTLSTVMLICVSPVLLMTALLIKLDSKGPVFFAQERVGERRKPYMIYKFRSMVDKAEEKSGPVWAKDDDDRVTRIGKVIRKTRIDELPQLWNVLKGDMSFVGPRPEREFFVNGLEYIIPYYSERFAVKPGVTGWAQVCYPYGASVKDAMEKLNYDLFYMKNMSMLMDIIIVIRTVKTVLFGKGAR